MLPIEIDKLLIDVKTKNPGYIQVYFDDNDMVYEIVNKENLRKRPASFLHQG